MIWAAGVVASPAATWIDAEHDRAGRFKVNADLSVPGRPEIFAVGDTAGRYGPARHARFPASRRRPNRWAAMSARLSRRGVQGRPPPPPFAYHHLGDLATIGRKSAVVKLGPVQLDRLYRLAVLERRPHLFFDRAAQPLRGRAQLAVELRHLSTRRPADRYRAALNFSVTAGLEPATANPADN